MSSPEELPARIHASQEGVEPGRFFQALLAVSLLTLVSDVWTLGRVAKQVVQSGGSFY